MLTGKDLEVIPKYWAVVRYIYKGVFRTLSSIYDGAFFEKQWTEKTRLFDEDLTQPAFTCSKLTIEKLEQDVKCV